MDAQILAKQFLEDLRIIASRTEFARISRVQLTLGAGWEIPPGELEEIFEDLFDEEVVGSRLFGAAMEIRVVQPGEEFKAPRRSDMQTASGFEMLVTGIDGKPGTELV